MVEKIAKLKLIKHCVLAAFCLVVSPSVTSAQNPAPGTETLKKANTRPETPAVPDRDPVDGATVEKMTCQCVTLDTESGAIVIKMLPAKATETVRSFLNLAAAGSLATTVFSSGV